MNDDQELPPPPAPEPRESSAGFFFVLVPMILLGAGVFWFLSRQSAPPTLMQEGDSAFNVDEVPEQEFSPAPSLPSSSDGAQRTAVGSVPMGRSAGPGLSGFVPEKDKMFSPRRSAKMSAAEAKESEREFVKKHDRQIQAELARLGKIGDRYWKKYPIVREVDAAFGKLPRYMALRDQYAKDKNPFDFVRNAVKLPEVQGMIKKYAVKPEVWGVAISMSSEALKQKPPQAIYDEAARFMTEDPTVNSFVTDMSGWLMPKMGPSFIGAIPKGTDLSALTNLASDINVSGAPSNNRRPVSSR